MENQVLKAIMDRRSHRKYLDKQISKEQLEALMDAMLASPSAVNRQPWHFSIVQDKQLIERVNQAAKKQAMTLPSESRSPRFEDPEYRMLYGAPTVIFISAPDTSYSPIDCGIAVQTIALAAESMGLGSVIIGMARLAFESDEGPKLEKALAFPEGHRFVIAICVGYPDDDKPAHEMNRDKISLIV